jgi:hypothetical protein
MSPTGSGRARRCRVRDGGRVPRRRPHATLRGSARSPGDRADERLELVAGRAALLECVRDLVDLAVKVMLGRRGPATGGADHAPRVERGSRPGTGPPQGLMLALLLPREPPADALVGCMGLSLTRGSLGAFVRCARPRPPRSRGPRRRLGGAPPPRAALRPPRVVPGVRGRRTGWRRLCGPRRAADALVLEPRASRARPRAASPRGPRRPPRRLQAARPRRAPRRRAACSRARARALAAMESSGSSFPGADSRSAGDRPRHALAPMILLSDESGNRPASVRELRVGRAPIVSRQGSGLGQTLDFAGRAVARTPLAV